MWWWWSLAFAQSEVCSPHPVERWAEEIEAVAEAQRRLAIARSETWLVEVMEGGRCLSEVAPPALLARLAELQAVQAMYGQDQLALEAWVRLRADLAPDTPWTVPETHPIHRFAASVVPVAPVGLPEGQHLAAPRKGGVFVDGAFAPDPELVPQVPHLVQLFDADGLRVDALWVLGAGLPAEWLEAGDPPEAPRWFEGPGVEVDKRPDWKAARKDTIEAYEAYLRDEPAGEHAAEARRRIDDLRWAATPKTPEGARAYLERWPEGWNRGNAEAILQGLEFQEALDKGTRDALQLFLGKYPEGVFAAEAQRRLESMAWARALAEDTEQAYARYRVRWPRGAHREEARLAHDEKAWEKAEAGGRRAIEAYARAWPRGTHAREARAYLDGLAFTQIAIEVRGDDVPLDAVDEAVGEAVVGMGFERVEAPGDAIGRLVVTLEPVPLGDGIHRFAYRTVLTVGSHEVELMTRDGLGDPGDRSDAEASAVDAVVEGLFGLERWHAQPARNAGDTPAP